MSDTDKTRPWRVKKARGEIATGPYVYASTKNYGRPRVWRYWANSQERRNRADEREALRRAKYDEDIEPSRPKTDTANWDTF